MAALVWAPPCNLQGNFHNNRSPWCPADEGRGCPQIPHSRAHLGGTNLTSKWNKGKVMALPYKSEENPREASASSSCHCRHWKPSRCQCHALQECGPAICAEVCCCHGSLSTAGAPTTPGSFTNRIQAAFRCVLCGYHGDHQPHRDVLW